MQIWCDLQEILQVISPPHRSTGSMLSEWALLHVPYQPDPEPEMKWKRFALCQAAYAVSDSYLRRELQLLRILLQLQSQLWTAGAVTCHLLDLFVHTALTCTVSNSFSQLSRSSSLSIDKIQREESWQIEDPVICQTSSTCWVTLLCTLCVILHFCRFIFFWNKWRVRVMHLFSCHFHGPSVISSISPGSQSLWDVIYFMPR